MDNELKVFSPYDESFIDKIDLMDNLQIEASLRNAQQSYNDRSAWLKPHQRTAILEQYIQLLEKHREELIFIAAREGGKPVVDTRTELDRAITSVITAIETIPQLVGNEVPMNLSASSENRMAYTYQEPVGVVFAISAFNHPINLVIHQIIPAIATGCPVLLKPSLKTPFSSIKLIELLHEAGLPPTLCQLVICDDAHIEKIVSDTRVNFMSFIGSSNVGWYLRSKLAPGAQCCLEHGGASPVIIEEDADLDDILPLLVKGGFYHAGQLCVSVQRVYINHKIIKQVTKKMVDITKTLIVGEPLDEKTDVGPLVNKNELKRIEQWVNQATENGAKVLCGGSVINDSCYAPTLLLDPPLDMKVSSDEIFGPVICLYSYKDRDEAIQQANSLPYCFHAAVITKNIDVALDTVKKLNATAVMVNDSPTFRVDWMPFGGRRHSGMGMSGIPFAMKQLCFEKMMVMRSPAAL